MRAAELQLAAQSARIGVSKSELYPSIALAGSVVLSATSFGSPGATLDWGLGPALVWNVFDYGRLTNQVLVQDARFQQLFEQYQDTVLRAARELDDAAIGFAYSARAGRDPRATRCRRRAARSTSPTCSTARGSSTSSGCSIRSARCSASRNAW